MLPVRGMGGGKRKRMVSKQVLCDKSDHARGTSNEYNYKKHQCITHEYCTSVFEQETTIEAK
jgi:hypothetical protein